MHIQDKNMYPKMNQSHHNKKKIWIIVFFSLVFSNHIIIYFFLDFSKYTAMRKKKKIQPIHHILWSSNQCGTEWFC